MYKACGCKQVGCRRRGALLVACRWSATGRWVVSSLWVSRTGSASDWCALQEALYKFIDTIQYNSKCCVLETYSFQPSFLLSLPASLFLFLSFSPSHIYFYNLVPI